MARALEDKVLTVEGLEVHIVQTAAGTSTSWRGRLGSRNVEMLGREWEVRFGPEDEVIGTFSYRMFTRETGPAWRPYVSSRWESPGWGFGRRGLQFSSREAWSKADAIASIVRSHKQLKGIS